MRCTGRMILHSDMCGLPGADGAQRKKKNACVCFHQCKHDMFEQIQFQQQSVFQKKKKKSLTSQLSNGKFNWKNNSRFVPERNARISAGPRHISSDGARNLDESLSKANKKNQGASAESVC